jgi:hypothetical protein
MNESFERHEVILTVEEAKYKFDVAMHELGEAAKAFGQYEANRDADLGLEDILNEKKAAAQAAFEAYMKTVMMKGEEAGIAAKQANLPL